MPLYMPLAYTMWNFPWRFKPKPVNIHAITFSSPHPQHHPQCTSPDVEEVEREGDVAEGDALKPFLNCHDFPWKPIEGKPSLKLMIHWLEVAFFAIPCFIIRASGAASDLCHLSQFWRQYYYSSEKNSHFKIVPFPFTQGKIQRAFWQLSMCMQGI